MDSQGGGKVALIEGIELRPYQAEGASWLAARSGALLGDTMGLGKTVQAIAALPVGASVLVICPSIATGTWAHHATWRSDYAWTRQVSRGAWRWPVRGEIRIVSYAMLPEDPGEAPEGCWVVMDEVHMAKNPRSKRTRSCAKISASARTRGGGAWGLSGTPLKNHPRDLLCVLRVLGLLEGSFGTKENFCHQFGASPKTGRFEGDSVTELGAISESCGRLLGRVMLRREYEEVIPDMPTRSWETITVRIDSAGRKACDLAAKLLKEAGVDLESATGEALGKLGFEAQAHIMATRKVVASAKLPATLELLTSYEASDSAPALLWSAHVAPVEAVGKRKGWTTIRGGTSPSARHEFESRFQAGDFRGAGITIGAGSTALTLTRSWRAFFNDLAWTPSDNDQAAGRNYRISQTRSVLYTSVVADHEVDQRLAELLGAKRDVIDASVRQARVAVGAVPQSAVERWQAKAAEPAPQHLAYMRPPWRARQEIAKALGRARGLDAATLRSLASAARAGGLSAKQTDLARKICARNGG